MGENQNNIPPRRRRPWFALTLGGGLSAALAAAGAPWIVVGAAGLFNLAATLALYLFMEGAVPAQEWVAAREAWRASRGRVDRAERPAP